MSPEQSNELNKEQGNKLIKALTELLYCPIISVNTTISYFQNICICCLKVVKLPPKKTTWAWGKFKRKFAEVWIELGSIH